MSRLNRDPTVLEVIGFFIFAMLPFLIWGGTRIVKYIEFQRDCGSFIKTAADANTVELAKQQLENGLKYLDTHDLKNGYTSLFVRTQDENIAFWHNNLKSSLEELNRVTPQTSQLERTNVLMKLRETLLDKGQTESVTAPDGITVYPNNWPFAMWGMFSVLWMLVFGLWGVSKLD